MPPPRNDSIRYPRSSLPTKWSETDMRPPRSTNILNLPAATACRLEPATNAPLTARRRMASGTRDRAHNVRRASSPIDQPGVRSDPRAKPNPRARGGSVQLETTTKNINVTARGPLARPETKYRTEERRSTSAPTRRVTTHAGSSRGRPSTRHQLQEVANALLPLQAGVVTAAFDRDQQRLPRRLLHARRARRQASALTTALVVGQPARGRADWRRGNRAISFFRSRWPAIALGLRAAVICDPLRGLIRHQVRGVVFHHERAGAASASASCADRPRASKGPPCRCLMLCSVMRAREEGRALASACRGP